MWCLRPCVFDCKYSKQNCSLCWVLWYCSLNWCIIAHSFFLSTVRAIISIIKEQTKHTTMATLFRILISLLKKLNWPQIGTHSESFPFSLRTKSLEQIAGWNSDWLLLSNSELSEVKFAIIEEHSLIINELITLSLIPYLPCLCLCTPLCCQVTLHRLVRHWDQVFPQPDSINECRGCLLRLDSSLLR